MHNKVRDSIVIYVMNIALIGMPGVGKTVIGRALAKRLRYRFIDVDKLIKNDTKLSLREIIDKFGEKEFLKIEQRAILDLCISDKYVVSPGGSAVYSDRAMKFLKRRSIIVFLDAVFKKINHQVKDKYHRGIVHLGCGGLRMIFKERRPLYEKYADVTIKLNETHKIEDVLVRICEKTERFMVG